MKLIVMLAVACMLATSTLAFGFEDAIATLAGFMAAIVHKDNLKEMLTCADDSGSLVGDVEELITDVKSFNFVSIFKAIQMSGKIIGEAPFILRECKNIQDDLDIVAQQAQIFGNIGELTERITKNYVWHYSEIMSDFQVANADASQGDYYGFGENMGNAVFTALQP